MVDSDRFPIAVALGAMVTGATTALVVRRSAVYGARAALALVLGIKVGLYAWIVASALGVAPVVAAGATAYTLLRLVGAAVLVVLGVLAWLRRWLERVTGTVLIGLGLRMAASKL